AMQGGKRRTAWRWTAGDPEGPLSSGLWQRPKPLLLVVHRDSALNDAPALLPLPRCDSDGA
ncbi:MAG TPA: hypothetical protein VNT24_02940, partial [Propionibacteriaceae bacterium]|nr:hypothetical protein [Propionibacteriaceae bacterium]